MDHPIIQLQQAWRIHPMTEQETRSRPHTVPARIAATLANFALSFVALALVAILLELIFRAAPALLPYGAYGSGRLDPELGTNVHGGRAIYNKGYLVIRDPNRDGFMDVDHEQPKPPGALRVGFFGDSYVESLQVPLEDAFFRRLPERLSERGAVEGFGFGISGWGTLHAKRAFLVYGERYDLDVAVYVFVENDLGDQMWTLSARRESAGSTKPFLETSDEAPGYRLRSVATGARTPFWFDAAKLLQRYSLLAHALQNRLALLRQAGVQVRPDAGDAEMSARAGSLPDANDLPGSWPRAYAEEAMRLGEIVLREWRDAAAARAQRLVVLYVPRGHEQLSGTLPLAANWLPWLERTCAALELPLIDPSDALAARLAGGEAVYSDHFSAAGHEVIADELAAWLTANAAFPESS
jgi:hypothetical protein